MERFDHVRPLANFPTTPIEVLGVLGELPLMVWLLVMGINSRRWTEAAKLAS